jgi:hypothetical protein
VEAARLEADRLALERLEAERLEQEHREWELAEAERQEADRRRFEAERREAEREEAARLEALGLEVERYDAGPQEAPDVVAAGLALDESDADRAWLDDDWRSGPYGPGSAYAPFDGSTPEGFTIKGHKATMLFHTRRSRFYSRIEADAWFVDEAAAEAAGFTRWDKRGTAAHSVIQNGGSRGG